MAERIVVGGAQSYDPARQAIQTFRREAGLPPSGSVSQSTNTLEDLKKAREAAARKKAEEAKRAAEETRKTQREGEIRRNQEREIKKLNSQLNKDLRNVKSRQEAQELRNRFEFDVARAVDKATAQKVAEGIIVSGGSSFVDAGRITKERAKEIISGEVPAGYTRIETKSKEPQKIILGASPIDSKSKFPGGERGTISPITTGYPPLTGVPLLVEKGLTFIEREATRPPVGYEQMQEEEKKEYKELLKEGNVPGVIRKFFFTEAGPKYLELSDEIKTKVFGGKKLTDTDLKTIGRDIGGTLLFGAFSPAFATGAAASQAQKIKQTQKQITKNRFEALQKALGKIEKDVASKKTLKDQLEYLKGIKNQLTSEEAKKAFEEFVRKRLIDKQIIKLPKVDITSPQTQQTVQQIIAEFNIPQLRSVGKVTGVTSQKNIFFQTLKQPQKERFKQQTSMNQNQLFFQLQRQKLRQKQKQIQKQKERFKQLEVSLLGSAQKFIQPQPSQLRGRISYPRPRIKPQPREKLKPPIPKLSQTPLLRALLKLRRQGQGVDVYTGMKIGKKRKIASNLPPFKALKFAQKFVDKNIEASFRLQKSGKKTKIKDISPANQTYKFRPSKRDPLYVVEKRKYRLDSPLERIQIKAGGKRMPKKKKKKKKR